jgi:hypothetical protein
MSELLAKLDPFGTGQVSFNAFVEGIQSFLSVNDLPAKVDQTLEENGLDRVFSTRAHTHTNSHTCT